ncbi:MAG: MarC family protein [Planctomycetia bacterium]|nr:MarC family protein [Planctomycetia bacterium]
MENATLQFIISTAIMLFLIMDPLGNLPIFVSHLRHFTDADYRRIVIRESLAALVILLIFLFFGNQILVLLHISTISLGIAGGIILFLIALKMVFGTQANHESSLTEPFLVPLAIPCFAGPSTLAMLILVSGSPESTLSACLSAVLLSWFLSSCILLTGRFWEKILGTKILGAVESLMGFLLTVVAVEMLINGLRAIFSGT